MSSISDFYHRHADMRGVFDKLGAVYEHLDPKRPHTRHRIMGLSKDFLATSQLCFEAFTDCMPFAVHMELDAPRMLPINMLMERQELAIKKCNYEESLTRDEEMRLIELEEACSEHGEAAINAFSDNSSDEFEKRRRDAEARLINCVRAFAFSCRSYQDTIYALFLIARGEKATEERIE